MSSLAGEMNKVFGKPAFRNCEEPLAPPIASSRLAYSTIVKFAREDLGTFCEAVLKDEETGDSIDLQPFQEEWLQAIIEHKHTVIWAYPESGKSQIMAVARIIWELGRDSRKRYAVLSSTQGQAKKIIGLIKSHISENPVVADVWPALRRGNMWTDTAIEVVRPQGIKDPSVQSYSPEGGTMQGSRIDGLVIDDVLTENNTRTRHQRMKLAEWIKSTAMSRLSADAWVVILTNAWHPDDLAHEYEALGWWAKRYPVLLPNGQSAWPERWPLERIEKVRVETLGPLEFNRQMMCQSRDESTARFKMDWIKQCLENGSGYSNHTSWEDVSHRDPELLATVEIADIAGRLTGTFVLPEGFFTVTGVDPGIGRKRQNDPTAITTLLIWPDGTRHLMEMKTGRWAAPKIIDEVIAAHDNWNSIVGVENNAAQSFLLQWAQSRAPGMRIKAFMTGKNKINPDYGVESLAAEMAAGKWLIPCRPGSLRPNRVVSKWITEMLDYQPGAHTGDLLMSSWIARELARALEHRGRRKGKGGTTVIG